MNSNKVLKIKGHIFEDWEDDSEQKLNITFAYRKCKICNHIVGTGNVGDDWFNSLKAPFMIRNPNYNIYRIPFCLECIMDDAIG